MHDYNEGTVGMRPRRLHVSRWANGDAEFEVIGDGGMVPYEELVAAGRRGVQSSLSGWLNMPAEEISELFLRYTAYGDICPVWRITSRGGTALHDMPCFFGYHEKMLMSAREQAMAMPIEQPERHVPATPASAVASQQPGILAGFAKFGLPSSSTSVSRHGRLFIQLIVAQKIAVLLYTCHFVSFVRQHQLNCLHAS